MTRERTRPAPAEPPSPFGGGSGRGAAVRTVHLTSLLTLLVLTVSAPAPAAELNLGHAAVLDAPEGVTFRRERGDGGQLGWLEGLGAPAGATAQQRSAGDPERWRLPKAEPGSMVNDDSVASAMSGH